MPTKANLLSALTATQDEILRLADRLTERERNESGAPENWGTRDILTHLGEGQRAWASDLNAGRRGETPSQDDRPDHSNPVIYEMYRNRPWQDIFSLLEAAYQELIDQLQSFSEAELNDPDYFKWLDGSPIWRRTAGMCFIHSTIHLFQADIARGDHESARRIARLEKEQGQALDSSERWMGMVYYNQGCYHNLLDEKEQALQELEKGMRLSAQMLEVSKNDSDLASLQQDPDFLAMLERVKQHT
jgi:hypothetical protein